MGGCMASVYLNQENSVPLSEFEIKKIEKSCADFLAQARPPVHIRKELDVGARLENQSVLVYEIRPVWNNPSEIQELEVAKATYVKTQRIWKIYWMRSDLKWHGYQPHPQAKTLEEFFSVIQKDEYACFWG